MGEIKMDRKTFMKELDFLLQDINEEERREALSFYEDYFDEAGEENEERVMRELGDPSRVAAIIRDSLKGNFDDHIHSGNDGFSNDDYQRTYEVIDIEEDAKNKKASTDLKNKWNTLGSRDRILLIVLLILAIVPLSGMIGGLFGVSFGLATAFFCLIFGFWIITFVLYVISIVLIIVGVVNFFSFPGAGFIYIGIGCVVIALAQIFGKIASWFFKECIPNIVDILSNVVHKFIHNRGVRS